MTGPELLDLVDAADGFARALKAELLGLAARGEVDGWRDRRTLDYLRYRLRAAAARVDDPAAVAALALLVWWHTGGPGSAREKSPRDTSLCRGASTAGGGAGLLGGILTALSVNV